MKDESYSTLIVSKVFRSLKLSTWFLTLLQTFPDLHVNPVRIKQRCEAPVLFPQQPLYTSAWFSSLWSSDKGGVGGGCRIWNVPVLPPFTLQSLTQSPLKHLNKIWCLLQEDKRRLMKSSEVREKQQVRQQDPKEIYKPNIMIQKALVGFNCVLVLVFWVRAVIIKYICGDTSHNYSNKLTTCTMVQNNPQQMWS